MPHFHATAYRYSPRDEGVAQIAGGELRRVVHGQPLMKVRLAHRDISPQFQQPAARLAIDLYTARRALFHRADSILDREARQRLEFHLRRIAWLVTGLNREPQFVIVY